MSGVGGFMAALSNWQGVPAESIANTQALWNTGVFQLVKGAEIVCGLMLVLGFLPWLAAIPLAPIAIGATVSNAMNYPQYVWSALVCALALLYLAYAYWSKYAQLFEPQFRS
jgi:uncharacterized membrane protein YphA (DoxX/SURF4 family)